MAAVLSSPDYFACLGLAIEEAPVDVVKRCYYRQALKVHPDKNKAASSSEAFKKLSDAYDLLKSPGSQQEYLKSLLAATSSSSSDRGRVWKKSRSHAEKAAPSQSSPKSFGEMQREFEAMQWAFEAANEAKRNASREACIKKERQKEVNHERHSESNAALTETLAKGADDRAQTWRKFRKKGVKGSPDSSVVPGASSETEAVAAVGTLAPPMEAAAGVCCWLCRRGFADSEGLARHVELSELHRRNLLAAEEKVSTVEH